jgi:hypothetical protein
MFKIQKINNLSELIDVYDNEYCLHPLKIFINNIYNLFYK